MGTRQATRARRAGRAQTGHGARATDDDGLTELMAGMAAGSSDALFRFLDRHRQELERVVCGIAASLHRRDLIRTSDDVSDLVTGAALVLFRRASGWQPGGAPPWIWAWRSIRAEVVAQVGHPTVPFDGVRHEVERTPLGHAEIDLAALATEHADIEAWLAAADDVASERDRWVHLEYQVQKHLGDPSPAHTVAEMFDLTPANVRQIDRRVRVRLRDHAFGRRANAKRLLGFETASGP